jgi:hypothetical protein
MKDMAERQGGRVAAAGNLNNMLMQVGGGAEG